MPQDVLLDGNLAGHVGRQCCKPYSVSAMDSCSVLQSAGGLSTGNHRQAQQGHHTCWLVCYSEVALTLRHTQDGRDLLTDNVMQRGRGNAGHVRDGGRGGGWALGAA